ncbi:valine--tRNA ligase [Phycisphaerales bacterium AB-hyl4]|uniref:Valine--tRNA ligase n=1 Tax=Natronomicrosphaera hydrolytica TaxID=3242702 RepID=A0ABV4U924_9BACT
MAPELPKTYQPADIEQQVIARWSAANAFHADPADSAPTAEGKRGQEPYSILIPPPNVTAALHLGHALNNTLQDVLTRYHRMLGRNAMWMPGTDHAGIATQTVVDKRLQAEGQPSLKDYKKQEAEGKPGREQFIGKVQAWKDEYEARILAQLKAMGCSCDFDRTRFTMDEVCAAAVREAFFRMFKDGLIYRGKRLVNWDPVTQTALADDEVEMQEVDGNFYYMKYPVVDAETKSEIRNSKSEIQYVTVATTRPETMLGDTAVAINPKDPRAAELRGKFVKLPIVNRIIPIVEDDYVVLPNADSDDAKAKYASGFLKVTPAHDPNDYEIGQRHGLEIINVMAPDASISLDHGWPEEDAAKADAFLAESLVGRSREESRKAIVRWFKEQGLLEEVRPYRHSVGHSYRSHVPVEPYLSDQWYVAVKKQIERLPDEGPMAGTDVPANSLAGLALRAMAEDQRTTAGKPAERIARDMPAERLRVGEKTWEGHLRFYPERYAKSFQQWHEGIRDWCISRQLWWGHRIPVWSATDIHIQFEVTAEFFEKASVREIDGKQYVCLREDDAELIELLEESGFKQDPDVLDTWFSSALWPLSTMGWPDPSRFPKEIPEDDAVLVTWNPTNTLTTAREIITLWVSRMVMFNLYFSDPELDPKSGFQRLPFYDVFVHAMIQDGHGQKMSKSLGNGVDPMDILHTHGGDAMRFTLTQMTTHTQDVRLPVDLVCPHTGELFEPKFITAKNGYKVMAPIQPCPSDPSKKVVTSYGVASGEAQPSDEMPLARNTSSKFDLGRNFANKLWNAVRFALTNLDGNVGNEDKAQGLTSLGVTSSDLTLPDRWILSRLVRVTQSASQSVAHYEFNQYAQTLYDFFWRDLCDWYIEAVKPTVAENALQRQVLATCLDASLRLLHPVMPFITERLWEHLNATVAERGVAGVTLPSSELLAQAAWPKVSRDCIDESAEKTFGLVQQVVSAVRQVRTQHTVPPRQTVELSAAAPPAIAQRLLELKGLIEVLANAHCREVGPRVDRPADAAAAVTGDIEIYLHGLIDVETERPRLEKRAAELEKQIKTLRGRLSNASYVEKAPAKLVDQSREQLAAAEREAEAVQEQLAALK